MLIDPTAIAAHWWIVFEFVLIVVLGKIGSVTLAALMAGQSVQSSVKIGLSMGQIGEFSFIIAGLGLSTGATDKLLYSVAVAVSGITTLLTPLLIRAAPAAASFVDRKLPRPLQTFAALYGSWLEQLKNRPANDSDAQRLRRSIRWLALDAVIVLAVVIGAAVEWERAQVFLKQYISASDQVTKLMILFSVAVLSAPFWMGVIRTAKQIGNDVAVRIFPAAASGKVDLADAPRRLVVVALQLAVVVLIGLPIVAITQPFLSSFQGAAVLLMVFLILAFSLWRNATNFQGHTRHWPGYCSSARKANDAGRNFRNFSSRRSRANH
jgi:monovalent cation:H+ antiporter-2, CPA2 family